MDALEKGMIIWFTPHQTSTLPKFQTILDAKWLVRQSTSSDDLCLRVCLILILRLEPIRTKHGASPTNPKFVLSLIVVGLAEKFLFQNRFHRRPADLASTLPKVRKISEDISWEEDKERGTVI